MDGLNGTTLQLLHLENLWYLISQCRGIDEELHRYTQQAYFPIFVLFYALIKNVWTLS